MAHIFYNLSIVIRLIGTFWSNLPPRYTEVGKSLGVSSTRAFFSITLPLLRPAIATTTLLIFLFNFTSYGVILILGGPQFSTIETEIYRQYITFLHPDIAGVLALLQMICTLLLMGWYNHFSRHTSHALKLLPQSATHRRPNNNREKWLVWIALLPYALFLLAPLLAMVWRSFLATDGSLTWENYTALNRVRRGSVAFISPLLAIRNSLGYAIGTAGIAGILGLISATFLNTPSRWRNWLNPLFMLPLGASAVTLGFGYIISFDQLRTSPLLVLIAHTLVALPFVLRALAPALQAIHPSWKEAAASLGATPTEQWRRIELPLIGRAWLVGLLFAFTMSMGEFGATSFIARPNSGYLTLPIAIHRFLGQPGLFGSALAMSVLLMGVCTVGFVAVEWLRDAGISEF